MKCWVCDGLGVTYKSKSRLSAYAVRKETCTRCNGTGEIQTNEEWIKSANTEQLAEWLRGVYWHCHEIDCEHCNYPWRCMEKGDIVDWLKQPHG